MKFLVIGLGSMGKRRIRCLKALGYEDIIVYDVRADRCSEAIDTYNVACANEISNSLFSKIDAVIISTPPDQHAKYAKIAIENLKPAFIEASVILEEVLQIKEYNTNNTFIAPSCTFRFHPIIKDIKSIITSGKYGKITNFSYHSGQYLPDWHPWENVKEFYVSNRNTGGAREIVPFELTWIIDIMGWPIDIKGYFQRTIDFGIDIEDTYAFVLKFNGMAGSIIVDVAARYAIRSLLINLESGQIQWRWDESCFHLYEVETNRWIKFQQPEFQSAIGYNKNIGERMYIEEIKSFIEGINSASQYSNNIDDDIKILQLLNQIENSDGGF